MTSFPLQALLLKNLGSNFLLPSANETTGNFGAALKSGNYYFITKRDLSWLHCKVVSFMK